ncbi:MAG: carboxypeptidase regulatory-like domain-containing protein [Rikenellaceae bacterium]
MTKKFTSTIVTLLSITLFHTFANNPTGQLTATVRDSSEDGAPIPGAIVELVPQGSTLGSIYYSTDGDGLFAIPILRYGNYSLSVSFLGYQTTNINFSLSTPHLELADILLKPASVEMEEVVKEIKALRSSQNGDSLQYNASSYKVAADADVEGLLQKMPGITVQDGTVTAQGETITKIYIDGREFFGGDVATALKSLPAEVVDRIELFNQLSDESQYTGMDDGQGSKTINIITKPNMREGVFGKLFGGVGYESTPSEDAAHVKYMGGGSVNIFKGTSRTSIITLFNNLNQQNFSFEDIMGATDEGATTGDFTIKALPGVANVNAVGINYSNEFGENQRLKVQGSYFFNQTVTDNTEEITRWYEEPATETIDSLYQAATTQTYNINNRLTGRIDYKINDRQSIMIRPTLSFQTTEPNKATSGIRYDDSNSNYEDGMQLFSNTKNSSWGGYNIGVNANYRIRLNDHGRFVSVGTNLSSNSYDTHAETSTDPNYPNNSDSETSYTYETAPTSRSFVMGNVNFMEPLIANRLFLNLSYRASMTKQSSDKRTYDTDSDYTIEELNETSTTNFAQSDYLTQSGGVGMKFYTQKAQITVTGYYQDATFDVNTLRTKASNGSSSSVDTSKKYQNATYSVVGKMGIDKQNSLRLYLNGFTTTPPIGKFTDNTTSTSYVTAGNSDLVPTYNNRLRLYYTRTNIERGRTLMFNCNATMSSDYIGSHIVLDPDPIEVGDTTYDDVLQYTGWVNLDTYYKLDSNVSYGLPLDFMKCNLNLNGGVSYTSTPSMYGGEVIEMGTVEGGEYVETKSMTYVGSATLGSNISDKVDFTLSWKGEYNNATNAFSTATTESEYFSQTASAYMKFVLFGGFTFMSNIAYRQYLGISNNYNDQYTLFNAFVGHKVMRDDRGEIIIGANDIFDQNMSVSHGVGTNYTQMKSNSTVGRYFSVQFIYNLRAFR